ncbi:hypothetical protein Gohar_008795 [Gossypium harknessii]|uniref:RNase H type-1 domain-containing protein n=1 Tax=Gossypium harknessii TaxID=34285 RepID=A0A7J9GKS9_9ROSI|nr:hypothetical protein [Gossypium harknessii]
MIPKGLCEEIECMVHQFVWGSSSNRDGRNVRCWRDPWIPNVGTLVDLIPERSNLDLNCLLGDMVLDDGTWNPDLFRIWLPEMIIFRLEDGFATTEGIVHDHSGQWILGYNRFLGSCSVFEAELWGILDGLSILIDRGYKEVQIRTNSIEMASAIHEITLDGQTSALIRWICQLHS